MLGKMKMGKKAFSFLLSLSLIVGTLSGLLPGTAMKVYADGINTLSDLQTALDEADSNTEIIVSGVIDLPSGTNLDGHGATVRVETPYVDANGLFADNPTSSGVFRVKASNVVKISNMTIMGGKGDAAIDNDGCLTLTNVTLMRSNRGLKNSSGSTILKDCAIVRNSADYGGGLLNSSGKVVMDSCSFSENIGVSTRDWGGGGAAENNGSMYLNNTVMSNNINDECGAAINNYRGKLYIMNSTITGNTAIGNYNTGALRQSSVYIVNSIITDNIHNQGMGTNVISSDVNDGGNLYYSVVGQHSNSTNITKCITGDVTGKNVFASYDTSGLYLPIRKKSTAGFSHPVLSKTGIKYYCQLKEGGKATTGGVKTYFDYRISDNANVTVCMSYDVNGVNTPLYDLPISETEVTSYIEGGARQKGVIGASGINSEKMYTVKLDSSTPIVGGTVKGATIYGESYAEGSSATVEAVPDSYYEFNQWIIQAGGELSVDLTEPCITFPVTSDITLRPEFIKAVAIVTKAPTAETLTYNGSLQDLVTAGEADGGEMQYALGTETEATEQYSASVPSATDAGTYYVWYKAVGDDNHMDSDALCVEVTIAKATFEFEAQGYTGEYDGQEHGITVSVTKPETGFAVLYGTEEGKYEMDSSPLYKDAGNCNVYYEVTADNFETVRSYETVAISKKKLVVTANAAEKNYGEEDPELTYVSDGLVGNDEITGQLTRAEGQNAGTYAIDKGTLTAGDNYEMTFEPALFTINRVDAEYTAPKANELVYDGTDQVLLTAGETSDGTILYSADGEGFGEEIPTGRDAGQYTVYYKVIGDENHEDTEVLPVEVAILQRGVSVTAENAEKVYGDADPEFTYRAEGLVEGDGLSGALSRKTGGNVGSYDILQGTLSAGDNYYIDYTSACLVIRPKDIGRAAVSTKWKSYDYNGRERKPNVTAVLDGKTLRKDKDFKVSYRNNKKVGKASYTVTGIGNYTGSVSGTFELTAIPVYRLFNRRTGEHLYTTSVVERQACISNGWNDEGIAWYAPRSSDTPIYRVMNPNNKNEHFYTKSKSEKDWLVGLGWRDEGIAWYSDDAKTVPIYRHYHPVQRTGNHHYTASKGESDHIVKYEGWKYEGIGSYAAKLAEK